MNGERGKCTDMKKVSRNSNILLKGLSGEGNFGTKHVSQTFLTNQRGRVKIQNFSIRSLRTNPQ